MTMTKLMRRAAFVIPALLLSLTSLSGCRKNEATKAAKESDVTEREGQGQAEEPVPEEVAKVKGTVGLLFPSDSQDEKYRRQDGELRRILTDAGFNLVTRYAKGDPLRQEAQLSMFSQEEDVDLILVDAVEKDTFGEVLAKEQFSSLPPVIAYQKLVMYTDRLKYFVTFDMRQIGHQIASEIVLRNELDTEIEENDIEAKTIEFFMEGPPSGTGLFLFNGMMEGLSPYFETGRLICPSGKISYEEICMDTEDSLSAAELFKTRIEDFYQEGEIPDIIFTSSDDYAKIAVSYCENSGYSFRIKTERTLSGETMDGLNPEEVFENTTGDVLSSETETEISSEEEGAKETSMSPDSPKEPLAAEKDGMNPQDIVTADFSRSITDILSDAQAIVTGTTQTDWPEIITLGVSVDTIQMLYDQSVAFTVFEDERALAQALAKLAVSYLADEEIEVSDYQQFDNGTKLISTVTCPAQIIDADNYQILVDNGYYEQYQLHFS